MLYAWGGNQKRAPIVGLPKMMRSVINKTDRQSPESFGAFWDRAGLF